MALHCLRHPADFAAQSLSKMGNASNRLFRRSRSRLLNCPESVFEVQGVVQWLRYPSSPQPPSPHLPEPRRRLGPSRLRPATAGPSGTGASRAQRGGTGGTDCSTLTLFLTHLVVTLSTTSSSYCSLPSVSSSHDTPLHPSIATCPRVTPKSPTPSTTRSFQCGS